MRDTVREYLMGPGDVMMTLSISFSWIFFFFTYGPFGFSVSPIVYWPAVCLLARAFCRPLLLNSQPQTKTKMLTCWSSNPVVTIREMNQSFQRPGATVWRFQESIFLYVLSSVWTWVQKQSLSLTFMAHLPCMTPFQIPLKDLGFYIIKEKTVKQR